MNQVHTIIEGGWMELKLHGNARDLTGQRFGRLVAIKPTERRCQSSGSIVWLCECDCGNEVAVVARSLRSGSTKSCGCLKDEITFESNFKPHIDTVNVEGTNLNIIREKSPRADSASGVRGVYWNKKAQLWWAYITFQGKRESLGYFKNKQDAINARKEAEEKYFKPILEKYDKK